jgi:hypothetical protein
VIRYREELELGSPHEWPEPRDDPSVRFGTAEASRLERSTHTRRSRSKVLGFGIDRLSLHPGESGHLASHLQESIFDHWQDPCRWLDRQPHRGVPLPPRRPPEVGVAYVRFAVSHGAHFQVMYRPDLYDPDDPARREAKAVTATLLYGSADPGAEHLASGVAAWTIVHGVDTLWLNHNLPAKLAHAHDVLCGTPMPGNEPRTLASPKVKKPPSAPTR